MTYKLKNFKECTFIKKTGIKCRVSVGGKGDGKEYCWNHRQRVTESQKEENVSR